MLVRVQVLLDENQKKMLKLHAESSGRSVSGIIRESVDLYLLKKKFRKKRKNTVEILLERAVNAPKVAPKDLSTNDDYLYLIK